MSDDNEILQCWIPSHTGISENEQVDKGTAFSMVPEKNFLNSIYGLKNQNKQIYTTTKAASLEQQ